MAPAITVTPAALAKVGAVRSKSGHPDACLRIAIAGRRGGQFVYELDLVASEDAPPGDLVVETAGLRLLVESGSAGVHRNRPGGKSGISATDQHDVTLKAAVAKTGRDRVAGRAGADDYCLRSSRRSLRSDQAR